MACFDFATAHGEAEYSPNRDWVSASTHCASRTLTCRHRSKSSLINTIHIDHSIRSEKTDPVVRKVWIRARAPNARFWPPEAWSAAHHALRGRPRRFGSRRMTPTEPPNRSVRVPIGDWGVELRKKVTPRAFLGVGPVGPSGSHSQSIPGVDHVSDAVFFRFFHCTTVASCQHQ